jgi:predicted PurR-regulated permease PerM
LRIVIVTVARPRLFMADTDDARGTLRTDIVPPAPGTPVLSGLAVAVIVVGILYFAREALIPIVLAVLLSFVLAPLVNKLRQIRVPRIAAVVISVVLALGIVLGLGSVIGSQVATLATELPRYRATIEEKVTWVRSVTVDRAAGLMNALTRQSHDKARQQGGAAPPAQDAGPAEKPMPVVVRQAEPSPMELLTLYLAPLLHPLTTLGIIFVVAVFMLVQREDLRDRMIRLIGANDLHRATIAIDDAAKRLSRYFLLQLCLNATFGVVIGIGLTLIGVPSPILWGVLAGLMRFVPYVGAFISGALPVALAAAVDPSWGTALWTLGLFVAAETVTGQIIEPLVYGHSTGLSPTAVVVAAIFWTWLWGPIGLLLSTPLTLLVVVIGRYVERMEFLDVLLGDRPALTPAENFYQRILAGDPDEALDYAERLLADRSLSAYYDDVALKGLQLAAKDLERGVLDGPRLTAIRTAIRHVVRDLDAFEDVEPAHDKPKDKPIVSLPGQASPVIDASAPTQHGLDLPDAWRGEKAILCIAGRGALDEAASDMLAQLLRKHGLGAQAAPNDTVSRDGIERLTLTGIQMICITYLEISGSPAHLRYLLRRIRRRCPEVPVLVGLWPSDEPVLTDAQLQSQIGADLYVATLRDAVQACLDRATGAEPAEEPGVAARKPRAAVPA